jgi:hypothetical protein
MHTDCKQCFLEQSDKLLKKYEISNEITSEIRSRFSLFIDRHSDITSPEASCLMHPPPSSTAVHRSSERSIKKPILSFQRARATWRD